MSKKTWIWVGMSIGAFIGGLIPLLWGESAFSFSGLIFNALGGFFGIWVGSKAGSYFS